MKIQMSAVFLSMVVLTGCSTLNESFDCPAPQGGTCKRMDQVYDMVNGHESLRVAPQKNPLVKGGKFGKKSQEGDGVMRLWVAPHEDTDGNYHQSTEVYTVVRETTKSNPLIAPSK